MDDQDKTLDRIAAIGEIDAIFKHLAKDWTSFKRAVQVLDLKTSRQTLDAVGNAVGRLTDGWDEHFQQFGQHGQADQAFVRTEEYAQQVESALKKAGIPVRGEFPNYEFAPFKLSFFGESGVIKLSIGRRSEQSKAFEPEHLAQWVLKQYRRVVEGRFEPARFCREMLSAYEVLNQRPEAGVPPVWGQTVPLKEIYRLLTLRQASRQEYPESLFIYDLARLREQYEIVYEGHRFEFVPSRTQGNNLVLVDRRGQETRVGSLVIYAGSSE